MERMVRRAMIVAVLAVAGLAVVSVNAAAPAVNSVLFHTRLWNDDPDSILTTVGNYPLSVLINDSKLDGDGTGGERANRHNFRFSDNGGVSDAVFMNDHQFAVYADVTITGNTNAEGGLNLTPWWSKDFDGQFMLRTSDGMIEVWNGRLPYYNFTANHGATYTMGETVRCGMIYAPNGLSEADPATIEYILVDQGNTYSSGPLAFSEGNPAEDPPYGLWGILNDARLGGFHQPQLTVGDPNAWSQIEFGNIVFVQEPAALALLALGGLAVLRRR